MKAHDVIVIGAGIIGVLTAEALVRRGKKVLVIDAAASVAMATSYANAGQLSFGYSGPWASPGLLKKLPGMLLDPDGPLRIRPSTDMGQLLYQAKWLRWFLMNARLKRYQTNKRRILALSRASHDAFQQLRQTVPDSAFDFQHRGTLQLFRDHRGFSEAVRTDLPLLKLAGCHLSVANADDCVAAEPALDAVRSEIAGGFLFHDDATGDCRAFAQLMFERTSQAGVDYVFGESVIRVETDTRVRGVTTASGRHFAAPTVVVANASWARNLLLPLGLMLPVAPVKGYSITATIADASKAPVSTVLDVSSKIAITRLGDRVRAGGTAEISGFNLRANPRRSQLLCRTVERLFPGSVNFGEQGDVSNWCGLRPMTPDGTPIIGRTAIPGLLTNVGHGTLGWTQAAGSAEHVARLVCGERTVLPAEDYELARYGRKVQDHELFGTQQVV